MIENKLCKIFQYQIFLLSFSFLFMLFLWYFLWILWSDSNKDDDDDDIRHVTVVNFFLCPGCAVAMNLPRTTYGSLIPTDT